MTTAQKDHAITEEDLTVGERFNDGLATLMSYDLSGDAAPHLGTVLGVKPSASAESGAEYVVWTVNLQTGGYAHGRYTNDLDQAMSHYKEKKELNNR